VFLLVNQLRNVYVRRTTIDVVNKIVPASVAQFYLFCGAGISEQVALECLVYLVLGP
jgi:hypothetical protein